MESIDGRVALVTGAAGGIGLGIAQALLARGAKVVLADIDAPQLAEARNSVDGAATTVALDITDPQSWADARKAAEDQFGPVDILCNNAGIGPNGALLAEMRADTFERIVRINLTGAFHGVATFAPGMMERGRGHVVNTASIVALRPSGGIGAYIASKAGLLGMTYALRLELAPFGIGVTALCPGRVDTRIVQTTLAAEPDQHSRQPQIASKGALEPIAVGRMVLRAILNNEDLIVTHGEYLPLIQERHTLTLAAFERLAANPA